MFLCWRT